MSGQGTGHMSPGCATGCASVARELRGKSLILLELRDFPDIAHACACVRDSHSLIESPMNFARSPETQATSMTYRATVAQLLRNRLSSRATNP